MEKYDSIKDERKVARLSVLLVLIVFSIKFSMVFFTNSLMFYAELADSVIDFVAVFITFMALKESQKEADLNHMFGHYKINSFAAFIQGLLILVIYFLILFSASINIFNNTQIEPQNSLGAAISLVIVLIIVSLISTSIVRIGKKTNNPLIIAQGVNFKGDLYRNITAIIGLIIIAFGYTIIDSMLAIMFSVKSMYDGLGVIKQSFYELTDSNFIAQSQIDELTNKIKLIPDLQMNYIKIKTAANTLDAFIDITLDKENSVFSASEISVQIKEIISQHFATYNCNSSITINSTGTLDKEDTDYLLESIRKVGAHEKRISNLHQVSIDYFKDQILVQFHINMDPHMSIKEAHQIESEVELKVANKLHEIFPSSESIQVISHVEPATVVKTTHTHSIKQRISEVLNEQVSNILSDDPSISGLKNLQILSEAEGLFITVSILVEATQTIKQVHEITETAEHALHSKVPNLNRCVIHAEPI
jgi:cation diffusion facilitator family transporter